MKNSGVVGIGCFANPKTLARVLKKMVEHYVLGNFEGLVQNNGEKFVQSEGIKLLETIIGGPALEPHEPASASNANHSNTTITGFFLALESHGLNLSIFTREGHCVGKKYTTKLAGLTRIREKRLH